MSDKQKLYFHKAEAKKVSRWWYNRKYCLNAVFLAVRMTKMKIGGEERLKSHPVKCKLIASHCAKVQNYNRAK